MNHKYARWIVILQELNLQFPSPKKKALILAEFIIDLPLESQGSLVNDSFPIEHLFIISIDYRLYGDILLFLQTHNFHLNCSCDDRWCIRHHTLHYLLIGDVLYRHGVDTILCHYLEIDEFKQVLNDCHSRAYVCHLSGMAMAQNILFPGYFWPTLFHDCIGVIKRCEQCQLYTHKYRTLPSPLHPVIAIGPLCKWNTNFIT